MCALEFPELQSRFHEPYAADGLVVWGLHAMEVNGVTDAAIEAFGQEHGVAFPLMRDSAGTYFGYLHGDWHSPFPLDVVIDRQGTVRYVDTRFVPDALEQVIQELLAE